MAIAAGLLLSAGPGIGAQTAIRSRAIELTLRGRVHTQFSTSSTGAGSHPGFTIRRSRLTVGVQVNDLVGGLMQGDFSRGRAQLTVGYVRLHFSDAFRVSVGQFKRPFDLFQLTSSRQILVIERDGRMMGLDTCPGFGGPCSFSRFSDKLGFSNIDIGILFEGDLAGGITWATAVTNGTGRNVPDQNATKSYTARVRFPPVAGVRLGLNLGLHDYLDSLRGRNRYAPAWGLDLESGTFDGGWHMQAGLLAGRNWQFLQPGGDPTTFATAQIIVTRRVPIRGVRPGRWPEAWEPVVRLSYGDPRLGAPGRQGWLMTPGIVLHLSDLNKVAVNLDLWRSDGATEESLKIQTYVQF